MIAQDRTDATLEGLRILVVEDEYLLADEMDYELAAIGAVVLGPAGSVREAIDLIQGEARIDGAALDLNLGGEPAFEVADLLARRGVPFVFTTGYDAAMIPARHSHVVRCEKPVRMARVASAIAAAIAAQGG